VGLILGWGVGLVWSAAEMAGSIAELASGLNPQALLGPAGPAGSVGAAPLVRLYSLLLALVFFGSGGLERWILALGGSFDIVPACCGLPGPLGPGAAARVAAGLLRAAAGMAAPVLLALLVVNVALGVAGRLTAQASLYFAALPAEAAAVLLAIAVTLGATWGIETRLAGGSGAVVTDLLRGLGGR
jgi:flagellar biosynthesis protein FliR